LTVNKTCDIFHSALTINMIQRRES